MVAKADVLRLKAQRASAGHMLRAAGSVVAIAAQRVRIALHMPDSRKLTLGVNVLSPKMKKKLPALASLQRSAMANRVELAAIQKNVQSLQKVKSAAAAAYVPRVSAFGTALYANPNPRVFPQKEQWDLTWELGVRLSWTVNETFRTRGVVKETNAQVVALKRRAEGLRDGIKTAVVSAYHAVGIAESAMAAAAIQIKAAEASLSAMRKIFRVGKATAVSVIDAETALTRARLQRVNAHIDLIAAHIKLEHAIGGSGAKS